MGGSVARSHPRIISLGLNPELKQLSALEHLNNASHISHIIKFTLNIPASHQIQSQFYVYFYKWYRNPNILSILYYKELLYKSLPDCHTFCLLVICIHFRHLNHSCTQASSAFPHLFIIKVDFGILYSFSASKSQLYTSKFCVSPFVYNKSRYED